jgi:hypothetical protein
VKDRKFREFSFSQNEKRHFRKKNLEKHRIQKWEGGGYTVKKRKLFLHFCGILAYIWRMIPSAVRGIFLLPPTAFFCIRQTGEPFHQQGGDFPGI